MTLDVVCKESSDSSSNYVWIANYRNSCLLRQYGADPLQIVELWENMHVLSVDSPCSRYPSEQEYVHCEPIFL